MPNHKDLNDAAVASIRATADGKADPRAVAPLLKDINVHVVGLRRDRAALKARAEGLEREVAALRQERGRHGALATELAAARSSAQNLEGRNAALAARLRASEERAEALQARLRACEAATVTGDSTFTLVKVKCLGCSLHFTLHTWESGRHTLHSLHCPECGQHAGQFMLWAEPGPGLICQHVPGRAPLVAVGAPPLPNPGSRNAVARHGPPRWRAGRQAGEERGSGD